MLGTETIGTEDEDLFAEEGSNKVESWLTEQHDWTDDDRDTNGWRWTN